MVREGVVPYSAVQTPAVTDPEATLQKVDETIFAVPVTIPVIRDSQLQQGPSVKPAIFRTKYYGFTPLYRNFH